MRQLTTLFLNGNILTMDREVPRVEALLVRDGRVAALGPREGVEALAAGTVRRVDLQGRTVVPGFNDCHCHVLNFGLTLDQIDVSPEATPSIEDIVRVVDQRVQRTEPGAWVLGRGYDQNGLQDSRHPTAEDLDRVSENTPVVLFHTSGHALTANSTALRLAGIGPETETPSGGEIVRGGDGSPTGVLMETAIDLMTSSIPAPTVAQGADAIVRAVEVMASQGITSATDAATGEGDSVDHHLAMYRAAFQSGRLAGRLTLMPQIRYVAPPESSGAATPDEFDLAADPTWLSVGATKVFADGALTTRTAAVRRPYTGTNETGILIWEPEMLRDMIGRAHRTGWQIATHAIGDAAVELVLDCYDQALADFPREDHRHRVEHCMMVDRELALRIQRLGVVPVMQPGFISRLGDAYISALGVERASQVMPMEMLDWLGIQIAFSSDRPVIPGAPLRGVRAAMQRTTPAGTVLGQEHCVTAMQAIRHYTAGSAYAQRADHYLGTLRRGALADFAVLSHNPAEVPAEEFGRVRVEMTVVGGVETFGE